MSPCLCMEWLKVNVSVGSLTEDCAVALYKELPWGHLEVGQLPAGDLQQRDMPQGGGAGEERRRAVGQLADQPTRQPDRWATYDSNYIDTCAVMQHTDTCRLEYAIT